MVHVSCGLSCDKSHTYLTHAIKVFEDVTAASGDSGDAPLAEQRIISVLDIFGFEATFHWIVMFSFIVLLVVGARG